MGNHAAELLNTRHENLREETAPGAAREGTRWSACTADGATVDVGQVLVCTNAYADPLVPGLVASIIAATSLQIATEPLPAPLRAAILPNGEVLSDTRHVIRYWRADDAGRLLIGGRGSYWEPEVPADWGHVVQEVRLLFPQLGGMRFTDRRSGRVVLHPDFIPRLHGSAPGCLVAVGCQGRGIGWQTAIGRDVAALVRDPVHEPIPPFAPIRKLPPPGRLQPGRRRRPPSIACSTGWAGGRRNRTWTTRPSK